jgi:hypothetical protein
LIDTFSARDHCNCKWQTQNHPYQSTYITSKTINFGLQAYSYTIFSLICVHPGASNLQKTKHFE